FYHTSNTINLVTASVGASLGIVEHTIFMPDLIDGGAPTHGIIFAKYVAQITKQQGRYAIGHRVLLFRSEAAATRPWANFIVLRSLPRRRRPLHQRSSHKPRGMSAVGDV